MGPATPILLSSVTTPAIMDTRLTMHLPARTAPRLTSTRPPADTAFRKPPMAHTALQPVGPPTTPIREPQRGPAQPPRRRDGPPPARLTTHTPARTVPADRRRTRTRSGAVPFLARTDGAPTPSITRTLEERSDPSRA